MNYRVLIQRSAQEALGKIESKFRQRIYTAVIALGENPRPPGCKKLKDSDYWRIRVGNYRVIYDVGDDLRIVLVVRIAPRGEAYR